MGNKNNQKTRSFATTGGKQKGFKNKKARQRVVTAIFVVIILILLALATLIIGKIIHKLNPTPTPTVPPSDDTVQIYKDSGDVHIGNLLIISQQSKYKYPSNTEHIINLYQFKSNPENVALTTITDKKFPTYELHGTTYANSISLDSATLSAFNQMMLDYCKTLDLSSHTTGSASKLNVAWGWSDEETLASDIKQYGNGFWDHAIGTTLTLKDIYSRTITEQILKDEFTWLYENAYKYGFVIRYPIDCGCDRDFDDTERVHLRYVGYEHAYYMTQNNLCLEEYLALVREHHKYSGEHLTFTADNGKTYEIYYVACTGDPTNISVPKNSEYSVSGDNMNGFIVTVVK